MPQKVPGSFSLFVPKKVPGSFLSCEIIMLTLTRQALVGMACYAIGMENKNHRTLISARAGFLGGRFRGSLRVYTLGTGGDASVYFSLRLWQAAAERQARLSGGAAYAH